MKRSRINPKRSKPRRGQATPEETARVRRLVYERSGGMCELKLSPKCKGGPLPWDGPHPWAHGHLVHLKSVGAGGATDELNTRWGCVECHLVGLHVQGGKGKIIPAKHRPEALPQPSLLTEDW